MSSHNKMIIGAIVIIVILIGIYMMSTSSSSSTSEGFSIENFPQSTPMNVMYSDASGNLSTTTDLGIQYLTVNGDSSVTGNSTVTGNSVVTGNSMVKGDSNLNGNVLSRDVFAGRGSQLKTDTIRAGTDHNGRLHLLGDNVYVMAKNGLRIATDPNSSNPFGPANGNLIVDGNTTVGGNLSISGWGNVKDTLSDLYAKINTLTAVVESNKETNQNVLQQLDTLVKDIQKNALYARNIATSCNGWACNKEGAVCTPGAPGSNGKVFVCNGNNWVDNGNYGT